MVNMKFKKKCSVCGRLFTTNRSFQKHCSPECCERLRHLNTKKRRETAHNIRAEKPKICPECGKQFKVNKHLGQKYCSVFCRNRTNIKTYERKYPGKHNLSIKKCSVRQKKKVIERFGGKCNRCRETDWRVLQVNHINGGGRKDFQGKGSKMVYKEILDGKREGEFNLLCANCNVRYEYEVGRRFEE